MAIAGLVIGHKPKVDTPDVIAHSMRNIILRFVEIDKSFLFHGHAIMTQ